MKKGASISKSENINFNTVKEEPFARVEAGCSLDGPQPLSPQSESHMLNDSSAFPSSYGACKEHRVVVNKCLKKPKKKKEENYGVIEHDRCTDSASPIKSTGRRKSVQVEGKGQNSFEESISGTTNVKTDGNPYRESHSRSLTTSTTGKKKRKENHHHHYHHHHNNKNNAYMINMTDVPPSDTSTAHAPTWRRRGLSVGSYCGANSLSSMVSPVDGGREVGGPLGVALLSHTGSGHYSGVSSPKMAHSPSSPFSFGSAASSLEEDPSAVVMGRSVPTLPTNGYSVPGSPLQSLWPVGSSPPSNARKGHGLLPRPCTSCSGLPPHDSTPSGLLRISTTSNSINFSDSRKHVEQVDGKVSRCPERCEADLHKRVCTAVDMRKRRADGKTVFKSAVAPKDNSVVDPVNEKVCPAISFASGPPLSTSAGSSPLSKLQESFLMDSLHLRELCHDECEEKEQPEEPGREDDSLKKTLMNFDEGAMSSTSRKDHTFCRLDTHAKHLENPQLSSSFSYQNTIQPLHPLPYAPLTPLLFPRSPHATATNSFDVSPAATPMRSSVIGSPAAHQRRSINHSRISRQNSLCREPVLRRDVEVSELTPLTTMPLVELSTPIAGRPQRQTSVGRGQNRSLMMEDVSVERIKVFNKLSTFTRRNSRFSATAASFSTPQETHTESLNSSKTSCIVSPVICSTTVQNPKGFFPVFPGSPHHSREESLQLPEDNAEDKDEAPSTTSPKILLSPLHVLPLPTPLDNHIIEKNETIGEEDVTTRNRRKTNNTTCSEYDNRHEARGAVLLSSLDCKEESEASEMVQTYPRPLPSSTLRTDTSGVHGASQHRRSSVNLCSVGGEYPRDNSQSSEPQLKRKVDRAPQEGASRGSSLTAVLTSHQRSLSALKHPVHSSVLHAEEVSDVITMSPTAILLPLTTVENHTVDVNAYNKVPNPPPTSSDGVTGTPSTVGSVAGGFFRRELSLPISPLTLKDPRKDEQNISCTSLGGLLPSSTATHSVPLSSSSFTVKKISELPLLHEGMMNSMDSVRKGKKQPQVDHFGVEQLHDMPDQDSVVEMVDQKGKNIDGKQPRLSGESCSLQESQKRMSTSFSKMEEDYGVSPFCGLTLTCEPPISGSMTSKCVLMPKRTEDNWIRNEDVKNQAMTSGSPASAIRDPELPHLDTLLYKTSSPSSLCNGAANVVRNEDELYLSSLLSPLPLIPRLNDLQKGNYSDANEFPLCDPSSSSASPFPTSSANGVEATNPFRQPSMADELILSKPSAVVEKVLQDWEKTTVVPSSQGKIGSGSEDTNGPRIGDSLDMGTKFYPVSPPRTASFQGLQTISTTTEEHIGILQSYHMMRLPSPPFVEGEGMKEGELWSPSVQEKLWKHTTGSPYGSPLPYSEADGTTSGISGEEEDAKGLSKNTFVCENQQSPHGEQFYVGGSGSNAVMVAMQRPYQDKDNGGSNIESSPLHHQTNENGSLNARKTSHMDSDTPSDVRKGISGERDVHSHTDSSGTRSISTDFLLGDHERESPNASPHCGSKEDDTSQRAMRYHSCETPAERVSSSPNLFGSPDQGVKNHIFSSPLGTPGSPVIPLPRPPVGTSPSLLRVLNLTDNSSLLPARPFPSEAKEDAAELIRPAVKSSVPSSVYIAATHGSPIPAPPPPPSVLGFPRSSDLASGLGSATVEGIASLIRSPTDPQPHHYHFHLGLPSQIYQSSKKNGKQLQSVKNGQDHNSSAGIAAHSRVSGELENGDNAGSNTEGVEGVRRCESNAENFFAFDDDVENNSWASDRTVSWHMNDPSGSEYLYGNDDSSMINSAEEEEEPQRREALMDVSMPEFIPMPGIPLDEMVERTPSVLGDEMSFVSFFQVGPFQSIT